MSVKNNFNLSKLNFSTLSRNFETSRLLPQNILSSDSEANDTISIINSKTNEFKQYLQTPLIVSSSSSIKITEIDQKGNPQFTKTVTGNIIIVKKVNQNKIVINNEQGIEITKGNLLNIESVTNISVKKTGTSETIISSQKLDLRSNKTLTSATGVTATRDTIGSYLGGIPFVSNREYYNENCDIYHESTDFNYYVIPRNFDTYAHPTELVIAIHGVWCGLDKARERFFSVRNRLSQLGYPNTNAVIGFSWPSNSLDVDFTLKLNDVIEDFAASYLKAFNVSIPSGRALGNFIMDFKEKNPLTRIKLVSHSLGAMVILSALATIYGRAIAEKKSPKIISRIDMFAPAIPSSIIEPHHNVQSEPTDSITTSIGRMTYGSALLAVLQGQFNIYTNPADAALGLAKIVYTGGNVSIGEIVTKMSKVIIRGEPITGDPVLGLDGYVGANPFQGASGIQTNTIVINNKAISSVLDVLGLPTVLANSIARTHNFDEYLKNLVDYPFS